MNHSCEEKKRRENIKNKFIYDFFKMRIDLENLENVFEKRRG